jgi:hypothetical protein
VNTNEVMDPWNEIIREDIDKNNKKKCSQKRKQTFLIIFWGYVAV